MIWLTWRQFRLQAAVVAGVLIALGILLALNGSHLVHLYDTSVATCGHHNDCPSVTQNFESQAKWDHVLNGLVLVTPALIGVFWGAPLVARELETRTNWLAWTQSVTRTKWLVIKLAVVGVASILAAGLISLMVTWWASPYDRLLGMPYNVFDQRDLVPIAYALFAFALGVAAGALIRKTLPAMAVTLVGFTAVSYTHLDVYKRQVEKDVVCPNRLVSLEVPVVDGVVFRAAEHQPDEFSKPCVGVVASVSSVFLDPFGEPCEKVPVGAFIAGDQVDHRRCKTGRYAISLRIGSEVPEERPVVRDLHSRSMSSHSVPH